MKEVDVGEERARATSDEISQVAGRVEYLYHSLVAMHDLCAERISNPTDDPVNTFVLLRELMRSAARDAEKCAETLSGDRGGMGYFEGHFGAI